MGQIRLPNLIIEWLPTWWWGISSTVTTLVLRYFLVSVSSFNGCPRLYMHVPDFDIRNGALKTDILKAVSWTCTVLYCCS